MIKPVPQRSLQDVIDGLWNVHRDAGELYTRSIKLSAGIWLVLNSVSLEQLESELDGLQTRFLNLEADLSAYAGNLPTTYNSLVMHQAKFETLFGTRDSTRGVLRDTAACLEGKRTSSQAIAATWSSAVAIMISIVAILVSVFVG